MRKDGGATGRRQIVFKKKSGHSVSCLCVKTTEKCLSLFIKVLPLSFEKKQQQKKRQTAPAAAVAVAMRGYRGEEIIVNSRLFPKLQKAAFPIAIMT